PCRARTARWRYRRAGVERSAALRDLAADHHRVFRALRRAHRRRGARPCTSRPRPGGLPGAAQADPFVMMIEPLLLSSRDKLDAALNVFFASVDAYPGFDPGREYSPKESEPFDALSDRYLRAFESALKFFRTWERVREAAPSESFR